MDQFQQQANELIGSKVPSVTFRARRDGDWLNRTSDDVFSGRNIVLFALPGAFTPTCSTSHVPRYNQLAPVMKEQGIDEVVCLSVNDGFVMEAWAQDQQADNISFLPDGNGEFSEAVGFLVDKAPLGFGRRSWRYSMYVEDGTIKQVFAEADKPGDPFEVSDAETMLKHIAPTATEPPAVTLFSKPGCSFCKQAKALLNNRGLHYEEITLGHGIGYSSLWNITGKRTAPQIYIDGTHIDGLNALQDHFDIPRSND